MRKLNKLAAAIAVALSAGVMAPQAHAVISAHYDQEGDAMLFPVWYGVLDNYYTIHNNSNLWVQGHLRFRGAAWSGELLDMDIILSPGDVFAFRITDLDGDGVGEVDQTIDPDNFKYTGLTTSNKMMEFSDGLFPVLQAGDVAYDPSLYPNIDDAVLADQMAFGYVEFFGEAVLVGCEMPPREGCDIDNDPTDETPLDDWPISAWAWDQADPDMDNLRDDLDGVGNWLSGQWWVAVPGASTAGMSGAALMFRDFRTDSGAGTHRVDTQLYPDSEVILHVDDPSEPDGWYVYRFNDTDNYEKGVSYNNTWGPTLADGDDYMLCAGAELNYSILDATGTAPSANDVDNLVIQPVVQGGASGQQLLLNAYRQSPTGACYDYWDDLWYPASGRVNSIAEVDLALNKNAQQFSSHFFDGGSNTDSGTPPLLTFYFAHFPTKFYRFEARRIVVGTPSVGNVLANYRDQFHLINHAVDTLLDDELDKTYDVELWDINENYGCMGGGLSTGSGSGGTGTGGTGTGGSSGYVPTSPAIPEKPCQYTFDYELDLVAISDLKNTQSSVASGFPQGQSLLFPVESNLASPDEGIFLRSYPGLLYAFDIELGAGIDLAHWLPMFRSEWVQ